MTNTRIDLSMINTAQSQPFDRVIYNGQKLELMPFVEDHNIFLNSGIYSKEFGVLSLFMSDNSVVEITDFLTADNIGIGIDGIRGRPGADGLGGADGLDGAQGRQGKQGPRGDTGLIGRPGKKGDKGDQGDQGDPGQQGIVGQQGEIGPSVKGDKGHIGEQGRQGNKGKRGKTAPSLQTLTCVDGILNFVMSDGKTFAVTICKL